MGTGPMTGPTTDLPRPVPDPDSTLPRPAHRLGKMVAVSERPCPSNQRLIGMIGGMSRESTAEYYRLASELVRERLGGLHSARPVLASVDFAEIEQMQASDEWERGHPGVHGDRAPGKTGGQYGPVVPDGPLARRRGGDALPGSLGGSRLWCLQPERTSVVTQRLHAAGREVSHDRVMSRR